MRMLTLVGVLALVVTAGSVQAVPFWYGQDEVQTVLTKFFSSADVTVDAFLSFDLAIVDNDREAKVLGHVLDDLIRPLEATLRAQKKAMRPKDDEVERYFEALYAREVHDELWLQVRPLKQAAFRKSLGELRAMEDEYEGLGLKVERLDEIRDHLKAIGRRFKEIE